VNLPYAPKNAVTGYSSIPSGGAAAGTSYTSSSDGSTSSKTSSSSSGSSSGSTSGTTHVGIAVIIAIIVVAVVVLAVAGGLIAFFCIRSKKQRRAIINNANSSSGSAAPMNGVANQPPMATGQPQQPQGYYTAEMQPGQAAGMAAPYSKAAEAYQHPQPGYMQQQQQQQQTSPQMQNYDPARPFTPVSSVGSPAPQFGQPYQVNPMGAYGQAHFAAEAPDTSVVRGPNGGHVAELG
jgi:flagellar basal body-associated protein FliL